MSKEVLEIVNGALDLPDNSVIFKHTTLTELKKALEQAQKQEKLLSLYQVLARLRKVLYDGHIQKAPFLYVYQYDIEALEKQIKELENE